MFLIRWANYLTRIYLATPAALRWIYWVLPILYILLPVDFMPDPLIGFGRLDDLLIVLFVFWALGRATSLKSFFKEAGRAGQRKARQKTEDNPETRAPEQRPHEVLGVSPSASPDEIKQAYRKLLSRFHPDQFTHLGEAFEVTAKRRTQEIVDAYKNMMAGKR